MRVRHETSNEFLINVSFSFDSLAVNIIEMTKKVIIEITESGYKIDVHVNDRIISEKWLSTTTGSRCVQDEFEESNYISDDLHDALNNMSNYSVMRALANES